MFGVTNELTKKYDAVTLVKIASDVLGGKGGGGDALTLFGRDALRRYQTMERKALKSIDKEMDEFGEMVNSNYSDFDD